MTTKPIPTTDRADNPTAIPADLYHPSAHATPLPGPDHVDADAIAAYDEHGYLAVNDVLSPDDVADAIQRLTDLAGGRVEGYRGIQRESSTGARWNERDTKADLDEVRKLWFDRDDPLLEHMPVHHPLIMRIVAALLAGTPDPAPDAADRPLIFQTMALLKPPRIGIEKPWHQDHAYFNLALDTRIVGVWIALDHATVANGCMHLIDGGHKAGPQLHWKRRDWQICDTDILGTPITACELKPGAALFFDGKLPHGTPPNTSGLRRRAMQFHYIPANAAEVDEAARLAAFGSEGKNVSC